MSEDPKDIEDIVKQCFRLIEHKEQLSDIDLGEYFDCVFSATTEKFNLYSAWVCLQCFAGNEFYGDWGESPKTCPRCGKGDVYEVGNYQKRASKHGQVFEFALKHLVKEYFGLPITPTPPGTRTHDFNITPSIAIEAKGSAIFNILKDGSKGRPLRAGLLRSDTEKKAFANAKKWKDKNKEGLFFIMSNAVPEELQNYFDETIASICDVSNSIQIESFIEKVRRFLDSPST